MLPQRGPEEEVSVGLKLVGPPAICCVMSPLPVTAALKRLLMRGFMGEIPYKHGPLVQADEGGIGSHVRALVSSGVLA